MAKKAPVVITSPAFVNFGDSYVNLEAKDNQTFGVNVGVLWNVNDQLDLGLSYRSAVTYKFTELLHQQCRLPFQLLTSLQLQQNYLMVKFQEIS